MSAPIAFVTGGNGFLGGALVRQLNAAGFRVRALLRAGADERSLAGLSFERVSGDVLQPETYRAALRDCAVLFHLAARYTHALAQIADMEAVNVEGVRCVLGAGQAAGIPRMVHVSTIGTIGQPASGALATEDAPFNLPHPSAYVQSKRAGEQVAAEFAAQGAPVVIVHPTAMIGAGDWRPTASGRRVLDFLHGRSPRYPAGGINWCPMEDVARGLVLAAEHGAPGRHYILGHAEGNLSSEQFLDLLSRASGQPRPPAPRVGLGERVRGMLRSRPDTDTTPERLTCDPSRAITELGMPQSSLLAAARAAVSWYRDNGYVTTP